MKQVFIFALIMTSAVVGRASDSSLGYRTMLCDSVDAIFENADAAMDTALCKQLKERQIQVQVDAKTGATTVRANLLIRSPSRQDGIVQTCSGVVDTSTKYDSLKEVSCKSVDGDTKNYRKVLCQAVDRDLIKQNADAALDTDDCAKISDADTDISFTSSHRVVVKASLLIRSPSNQNGIRVSCTAYVDGVATEENVMAADCK